MPCSCPLPDSSCSSSPFYFLVSVEKEILGAEGRKWAQGSSRNGSRRVGRWGGVGGHTAQSACSEYNTKRPTTCLKAQAGPEAWLSYCGPNFWPCITKFNQRLQHRSHPARVEGGPASIWNKTVNISSREKEFHPHDLTGGFSFQILKKSRGTIAGWLLS